MKTMEFTVSIAIEDAGLAPAQLTKLVWALRRAPLDAIPDIGGNPPVVDVRLGGPQPVPKVVLTVDDGRAEVKVDGVIELVHADCDREGDAVTSEQIDAILEFETVSGGAEDVRKAIADARVNLERYVDADAPRP